MNPCTTGSHFFMVARRTAPHVGHGYFAYFAGQAYIKETSDGVPDDTTVKWEYTGGVIPDMKLLGSPSTDWNLIELSTAPGGIPPYITPYFNGVAGDAFEAHGSWNASVPLNIMDINGDVAEYIWYNAPLGVTSRQTVRSYFRTKYPSLTISTTE
jgi:hypothetical protein